MSPDNAPFNKDQILSLSAFGVLLVVVTIYMLTTFKSVHAADNMDHEPMMPPPSTASP